MLRPSAGRPHRSPSPRYVFACEAAVKTSAAVIAVGWNFQRVMNPRSTSLASNSECHRWRPLVGDQTAAPSVRSDTRRRFRCVGPAEPGAASKFPHRPIVGLLLELAAGTANRHTVAGKFRIADQTGLPARPGLGRAVVGGALRILHPKSGS